MNSNRITILRNLRAAIEEGNEFEAARLVSEALRGGQCDPATLSLQCRQHRSPIRAAHRHAPSAPASPV